MTYNTTLLSYHNKQLHKSTLLAKLTQAWALTSDDCNDLEINSYHLKYYSSRYIADTIADGTIYHRGDDIRYAVIWYRTSPALAYKAETLHCSFRSSPLGSYVLIRIAPPAQIIGDTI
jgi:hypothetical protein